MTHPFCRLFERYLWEENGALLPLIGLASAVLIGAMGLAIDVGRAYMVHAKLLNAADAGGLAAGARMNTSRVQPEVEKFVRANFPDGYAGAHITRVEAKANSTGSHIDVTAAVKMPTVFVKIFGFDDLDVTAHSEITRESSGLELALVLDNTGSMSSGGKIQALKAAANELLDIVFGDGSSHEHLYVSVVPFSQTVNVGKSHASWLAPGSLDDLEWGPTSSYGWDGCVEARAGGGDRSEAPPSAASFTPYYYPDPDDSCVGWSGDRSCNNWREDAGQHRVCTLGAAILCNIFGGWKWVDDGPGAFHTPFHDDFGPNAYCPEPITPLTDSRGQVSAAIASMNPVGATHINLGAVWGWRTLSPQWRGKWGGSGGAFLPADYREPLIDKALVLMTDGENTIYDRDWDYTAYGNLSDERLGTSNENRAREELDDRLEEVCESMKNEGVIVYTISFGRDVDASTKSMMRRCASQSDFYFDSPDSAELLQAFRAIGDSLSNLRVSH